MSRRYGATVLPAFLIWSMSLTVCRAEDWLQFRGPTGQGHVRSGRLPLQWSDTRNVVWKTRIPGEGWSSPVVHDGRVYLTTAVPLGPSSPTDHSLRLLRLRASDGELLDEIEIFAQDGETAPKIHSKNSHASPTPLIDGGRVFVHFGHQGTACLDLNGQLAWKKRIEYRPVHGNGGTPIVVGKSLIFSCDGAEDPFVTALHRDSGETRWTTFRDVEVAKNFSFSTPLRIDVDGQAQVISPGSNVVSALDPENGREIWRVRYEGYSVIPRPVFGGGLLFVCTGYDSPRLLAIRVDGQGDVTDSHVEWTIDKGVPHTPSLLLVGDELYMVSDRGIATCVDAASGKVHWRERIGGNFSASPIHADGRIYLHDESGNTTVVEASTTYRRLAESGIGERSLASFAAADDSIFIRGDEHLFRVRD